MNKELLEKVNELDKKIEDVKRNISRANSMMDINRNVKISNGDYAVILTNEQKIMFLSMLQFQLTEELSKLQVEFEKL